MGCDSCKELREELKYAWAIIEEKRTRKDRESAYIRDSRGSFSTREESPCFATPRAAEIAKKFRLTVTESRALDSLYEYERPLSKTELMNAMDSAGGTSTSIVRTVICNIRKKIGHHGAIEPVKYFGYKLTDEGREHIKAALHGS